MPHEMSELPKSVIDAFSSSLSLAAALQKGLIALGDDFPAQGVFSNTYYQEKREVRFLAMATRQSAKELFQTVLVPEEVDAMRVSRGPEPYVVDDIAQDPLTAYVAPKAVADIRSYVMVPVRLEGRHLGVVCFWSNRYAAFDSSHLKMLEHLHKLLALNVGFALGARLATHSRKLEVQNQELTKTLESVKQAPLTKLITNTPSMKALEPVILQAASFDVPVMITGESGTGKEVVAQTIHRMSSRAMMPFVRVNCSAIPDALLESELFGNEAGAFTDAKRRRIGLFEEADGGTLFLDEIGELPLTMQAKLLHAVQDQTIRRVGSSREIRIDVRIISATNRDMPQFIAQKQFRMDLFYRLNVLGIKIKPLRERSEDFYPLLRLFAKEVSERFHVDIPESFAQTLAKEALHWPWPGNVRELRNTVIRSALAWVQTKTVPRLLTDDSDTLPIVPHDEVHAKAEIHATVTEIQTPSASDFMYDAHDQFLDFEAMQKAYFSTLLAHCHGKISGTGGVAQLAHMHPNTLRSRLEKLGLL